MSAARSRVPGTLSGLLRSELERVIFESALHRDDALVATRTLIERVPQIDIAEELGWERSTVSRRLAVIMPRLEATATRLFP